MTNDYEQVNQKIEAIVEQMTPYASEDTLESIRRINQNFSMKIADFHREGRKLNIGVIGRVKAGKSSFLNTLLFNGQEVLPKAATPKTATLTKMEYAEQNRILIEFYSVAEWEAIEEDARLGDKNEITKSARELVTMARDRGIHVQEILERGNLDQTFETYQDLLQFLNDYVGENGTYTPLVRSVVIYMNRDEFKDISIVDTPGLNDPIPSRTQRTKEFIEVCDVVFFLSRASSFLDMNDWELLCKQLPQKGVKKMVLVASQYDSGLRDVLKKEETDSFFGGGKSWRSQTKGTSKATNLPDAKKIVAESLEKRIREKIASFEAQPDAGNHDMILHILKDCQKPVFVSARAQDMSGKSYAEYSQEEQEDCRYWKGFLSEADMAAELGAIGNFDEIREIYTGIKTEKQRLLEEKEREFIPTVYGELKEFFCELKRSESMRLECLQSNDKESLQEQRLYLEGRNNAIKADVAEVFGDTLEKIKQQKMDVNKTLRDMSTEAARLETHTGQETHHGTHTTYRFKLGPIRLGRSSQSYSYTTTYQYLAASDALEQIHVYGKKAANEIETVFRETVDMKAYRRKLLETVIHNLDSSDQNFDANYFRIVVQQALNRIAFPEVHIDVSKELTEIGNQFSGEVRNSSDKDRFRKLLSETVEGLYHSIVKRVDITIQEFQDAMLSIQETLCDDILEKITKELEKIQAVMEEKEAEVAKANRYLAIIDRVISDL